MLLKHPSYCRRLCGRGWRVCSSGYRFRAARFLVILLRAAFAAVLAFPEAFFALDFERFIIDAAPTMSALAIAGRNFAMLKSPLS
jgi:hypothetical protein